ncbi:MAG: hypothetical protein ABR545_09910 [Cyclonatronaceae bacterium]
MIGVCTVLFKTGIFSCDRSMRDIQPCEVQIRRSTEKGNSFKDL